MIYSYYKSDQFNSSIYQEVAKKLISLASNEDTRIKMERYII